MLPFDLSHFVKGFQEKNRTILARAITLSESTNPQDQIHFRELMKTLRAFQTSGALPQCQSKVIGFSGAPGVGKSSFIENFGSYYLEKKKHLSPAESTLAILAIDPSSQTRGGSILGDKTRMTKLAANENVFIRPSPSLTHLGGLAPKTYDAVFLCQAFGFETIFIETVGVGQSEIDVKEIVDFLIFLTSPHAGDDLQGIKRGILEVIDLALVNKADGDQKIPAQLAREQLSFSLSLLSQHHSSSPLNVFITSAIESLNYEEIYQVIDHFFHQTDLRKIRKEKRHFLIEKEIEHQLLSKLKSHPLYKKTKIKIAADVSSQDLTLEEEAKLILHVLFPTL